MRLNQHSIDVLGVKTDAYRQILQITPQMKAQGPDIGHKPYYDRGSSNLILMGDQNVLVCPEQKFNQNLVFEPAYLPEIDLVFLAQEYQGPESAVSQADCYLVDPQSFKTVCKFKSLLSVGDIKIRTVLAVPSRRSVKGIEEHQLLIQYDNLLVERVYLFNPNNDGEHVRQQYATEEWLVERDLIVTTPAGNNFQQRQGIFVDQGTVYCRTTDN